MARKRRYHIPGAFYHVLLRGNNGQTIFDNDEERCRMCWFIQEGLERFGHRIHAFCLMGNHVHLLVQVGKIPLSTIVHNLAFRYSQYFNRKHKKVGHLFQGRFKAILIQERAYFLRLLRYIHMNPVRAHLVKEPENYLWSGHKAYLGQSEIVWLTTEHGLRKFADQLGKARFKYQNYVLNQESEKSLMELRQGFSDSQILGDDNFLEDVRQSQNEEHLTEMSLEVILRAVCHVYNVEEKVLSSASRTDHLSLIRGAAITLARQKSITIEEVAKVFKRDGSSLGRLMQRFLQKKTCSVEIQNQYLFLEEIAVNFAVMQA